MLLFNDVDKIQLPSHTPTPILLEKVNTEICNRVLLNSVYTALPPYLVLSFPCSIMY